MYSHTSTTTSLLLLRCCRDKSVFLVVGIPNLNLCSKDEITRINYI